MSHGTYLAGKARHSIALALAWRDAKAYPPIQLEITKLQNYNYEITKLQNYKFPN